MTTSLTPWLAHPLSLALGRTLLHFVWQGAVLWLVAAVCAALLKRTTAARRYGVLLLLFALMSALPLATLLALWPAAAPESIPIAVGESAVEPSERVGVDFSVVESDQGVLALIPEFIVSQETPSPARESVPSSSEEMLSFQIENYLPWFVAAWLLGVAGCSLRLWAGLFGVIRVRWVGRSAAPEIAGRLCRELRQRLGVARAVQVCESLLVQSPVVVGWLKPLILFPVGMITGLDEAQLRALLTHELAHLRRHDYLVNIFQTMVETLLFYHPGVWWLSRRLRQERELCCDDIVVQVTGDRLIYARTLSDLANRTANPALAAAATDGSLLARIRHILGKPAPGSVALPGNWAVVVLIALVAGGGAAWQVSVWADQTVEEASHDDETESNSAEEIEVESEQPEADGDYLIQHFTKALRRQAVPYLDDAKIQFLSQSLHAGIAPHLKSPLNANRRQQLANAIEAYVQREFDPAEKDSLYLEFQNRFQTLKWVLGWALDQPELTADEILRLDRQRQWMRSEIEKLPESAKFRLWHEDELAKLETLFDDPLNPFLARPMSDDDFALFQAAYQKRMEGNRSESRLVFAASWLFQGAWTVQRDGLLQKYPLENVGSSVHNLRWSLTVTRHNGNVALDIGDRQKQVRDIYLDVMKMIFVPGDAPADQNDHAAWLREKGQGDLAFDGKDRALVGMRGAKLAILEATDWQTADQIPLAKLEQLLETSGQDSISLSTFVDVVGNPANGISQLREQTPSLAIRTNEGQIAVIRILSMAGDTPVVRARPRPLPPNPPLHSGDVVEKITEADQGDLRSAERRGRETRDEQAASRAEQGAKSKGAESSLQPKVAELSAREITGRIVDQDGKPVAKARVVAQSNLIPATGRNAGP